MVVGTIGSGKTLTIRMIMQAVLPQIGRMPDWRAVILDPKQEYYPYLDGMNLRCPIIIVNPFDVRSWAWDIARDCTTPAAAREIASIFIPLEGGQNRFFYDSSRHIIAGVITVLIKLYGQKWTLLDLIRILRDKAAIRAMLAKIPETRDILNYCEHDDVFKDIHSTILTQIAPYETIVAAWSRAPRKFSLSEFIKSDSILLLTLVEEIREPMMAIYRVLFKRLSEFLLSQSETTIRRTWIIEDEAKELGELDGMGRLCTEGRSRNICIVMGFQDPQGLQEIYKEKIANELLGQFAHKAILRTQNAAAAEWLSQLIGEYEALEQTVGFPVNGPINVRDPVQAKNGAKQNVNDSVSKRQLVLPSEIMNLPPVNKKNGIVGYYLTPTTGCFKAKLRWEWLKEHILPPGKAKSYKPRPASHQYLRPFTTEDLERLGLDMLSQYKTPSDDENISPSLAMITRKTLNS
jgi:type IV secretory pathway TraG/TraD family ATPase VirD4